MPAWLLVDVSAAAAVAMVYMAGVLLWRAVRRWRVLRLAEKRAREHCLSWANLEFKIGDVPMALSGILYDAEQVHANAEKWARHGEAARIAKAFAEGAELTPVDVVVREVPEHGVIHLRIPSWVSRAQMVAGAEAAALVTSNNVRVILEQRPAGMEPAP